MNKVILGAVILGLSISAQAKDYGAAGCGLGAKLFEGKSGLGPHVFAATTNNFYGTQTFAMTSGTLGCDVSGPIQSHWVAYIESNLDSVAQDAAQGNGEALDALASLMGVEDQDRQHFNSTFQSKFDVIFASVDSSSSDVLVNIVTVMKSDSVLKKYVA